MPTLKLPLFALTIHPKLHPHLKIKMNKMKRLICADFYILKKYILFQVLCCPTGILHLYLAFISEERAKADFLLPLSF